MFVKFLADGLVGTHMLRLDLETLDQAVSVTSMTNTTHMGVVFRAKCFEH